MGGNLERKAAGAGEHSRIHPAQTERRVSQSSCGDRALEPD